VGLRYTTALPTLELSSLSGALHALVLNSYDCFVRHDWGSNRARNDKTFDSHADHFECWLQRNEYSIKLFARLLQDEAIAVVGTYIRQVNLGDSLKSQANLTKKTLMGYLKSAATLYHSYAGAPLSLYVPAPTGGKAKLHPFLADILQQ
jgi:hypothetical protein